MGLSVKGNSVTAILDCNEQDTQEIKRNKVTLKTDGIILFGQEIDDQEYFDVRDFLFGKIREKNINFRATFSS